jgi:hypothetical protein
VNRATSILVRMAPICLVVLFVFASSTAQAAVTTYTSLESFLDALGSTSPTLENFDEFEPGTIIDDQIPGVVIFSSNAPSDGYNAIHVDASAAASSAPNMLVGGSVSGSSSEIPQVLILDFSPTISAFAIYLTAYDPAAVPGSLRIEFENERSETFSLSNTSESENTPVFFGATSDSPIVEVRIRGGFHGGVFEDFGIDDLRFVAAEAAEVTNPPVCSGRPETEIGVLGINGTATDIGEFETGIESVALEEGSDNLSLVVTEFEPGAGSVSFRVTQTDPTRAGQGRVIATDGEEKFCTVSASFRALGAGPTENQVVCQDGGLLLAVSNGEKTPAGTSACSANLPGGNEPAFPPGYTPSDPGDPFPCQVLTLESPLRGETSLVLKKDGDFDPDLRLLFSHSQIVGGEVTFPPFADVTQFVEQIDTVIPDPTRVGGSVVFSPVKVSCGIQSETARLDFCAGLPSGSTGPDADGDGFGLCAASVAERDCNDQIGTINPRGSEVCNGLDDDCKGGVDEDDPPGIPCPVPGLLGACRQGLTSCATLPLTCTQTVFPVAEVACNGIDDDCDGRLDEVYNFSGYLPPIKPDGSVAFLKKRGAIPVKFQLTDCTGHFITNAVATIEVLYVGTGVTGDVVLDVSSVGSANTGNLFRYDPDSNQYIYNLSASSLASNSMYKIRAHLDDGTTHEVMISIK